MSAAAGGTTDPFGPRPLAGLHWTQNIVSPLEELEIVAEIDRTSLSPFRFQGWLGKRLTTSYGAGYDFDSGSIALAEPIPTWLESLRDRAAVFAGLHPVELAQALLTRYDPGAGIGWHRDRSLYEHVVGVSIGAPATMRFRRRTPKGFERVSFPLSPRSVYHLSGEARHVWEHSIAKMTETRWSVTFRSLSASGLEALRRASNA